MRGLLALVAVGAIAIACGGADTARPARGHLRLEQRTALPVYWLGEAFEGLSLTHADPPALLVYGECNGEGSGDSYHCTGPQIQIQHWPLATVFRYGRWRGCRRTTIRGVPAAQFGGFEVYTGPVLVKIYAPDHASARRAAAALRPVAQSAPSTGPLPRPARDVSGQLRQCALDSIDAKLRELRAHARVPLLWAGRQFRAHRLFFVDGNGRWVRFLYGSCSTPEVPGTCWPPLTIEIDSVETFRPRGWHPSIRCTRLRIRGTDAALVPSAHELVVFPGGAAVRLQGRDLRLLRAAAEALRPLAATKRRRLPPTRSNVHSELRRVCRR